MVSAINKAYPTSLLVRRLQVLQLAEAQAFLQKWPQLLEVKMNIDAHVSDIQQTFHETPTRNAFSAFSARVRNMEQLTSDIHSQIQKISTRTEQFSPSNKFPSMSSTSQNHYLGPSIPFPILTARQNAPQAPPPSPAVSGQTASNFFTPNPPSGAPQTPQRLSPSSIQQLNAPTPCIDNHPMLIPITIEKVHKIYHVLPLTATPPNEPTIRTQHDPILPPQTAFPNGTFPKFTSRNCTWQYILEKVVNLTVLWDSYAPQSLGFYSDIKMLWQWWDKGSFVEGVGRLPALCLIEARWGILKNQATNKGKFPAWRPRNNALVSKYI
jgi:hypothetical protein